MDEKTAPQSPYPADRPGSPKRVLREVNVFRYVTAPNAPTYRAIVQVFCDALHRYTIQLRPSDVLDALADYETDVADAEELELNHLTQLVSWGNLACTADIAGVDRLEDFYRRRLVYHLTEVGEAAHRAVEEIEATLGRSGSLQANMLVKIRDALRALAAERDSERAFALLHDLHAAFETLTHEANRFMTDLGRVAAEGREGRDELGFVAYKQAVLEYVARFVDELRRLQDEIGAGLRAVREAGIAELVEVASHSADLPDFERTGEARRRWAADQLDRWSGVEGWFLGDGSGAPTVERLAEFAVGQVVSLTRLLGRLNDRRGRPVDRRTDFLTLAWWFAACPTDADAHHLWQVAFGLYPARHMHVAEEDPELTSTRASWWDAAPVEIPTRLRTHGRTPRTGRFPRAADHSEARTWLGARVRRERRQLEAALERFRPGPVHLSDVATLDPAAFDLLLELLDTALTAPRAPDGTRATTTADGRLRVALRPPADGATCRIETPSGALCCPDYAVEADAVRVRGSEAAS